jgi:hypothetical protein
MVTDYLDGAIDLHIHIGPDDSPRYYDSIDLARDASNRKMRAVVIKDHLSSSASKAVLSTKVSPGTLVFGAIALNETVGGLNPRSVVSAIRTGGKVVWMPTVDASFCVEKGRQGHWIKEYIHKKSFGYSTQGISLLTADSRELKPEVPEIMSICHRESVILSTGHVGPRECLALAELARRTGFDKLVVCHPNAWLEDFTLPILKELGEMGAYLELTFGACSPLHDRLDPHRIAEIIRLVSPSRCVLSTDYGQVECAPPPEGLRIYCAVLSKCGISDEEITMMTKTNPARLLGLEA